MNNFAKTFSPSSRHGFTLIELVVAAGMLTIVGTIVYATWSQIDRHLFSQQRITALHRDCGRIINEITNQVRCSEAVVRWDNSSITFVAATGSDTVRYSFNGYTLEKNELPVTLLVSNTIVSSFALENLNNEDGATPYLLQITLSLQHATGLSVTERSTVLGRRMEAPESGSNDIVW